MAVKGIILIDDRCDINCEMMTYNMYLSCDRFHSSLFYLFINMARSMRNWFIQSFGWSFFCLVIFLPKFLVSRSRYHNKQVRFNVMSVTGLWICKLQSCSVWYSKPLLWDGCKLSYKNASYSWLQQISWYDTCSFWSIHYFIVSCEKLFLLGFFSWQIFRSVNYLLGHICGPQVMNFYICQSVMLSDCCLVLLLNIDYSFSVKVLKSNWCLFSINWHWKSMS